MKIKLNVRSVLLILLLLDCVLHVTFVWPGTFRQGFYWALFWIYYAPFVVIGYLALVWLLSAGSRHLGVHSSWRYVCWVGFIVCMPFIASELVTYFYHGQFTLFYAILNEVGAILQGEKGRYASFTRSIIVHGVLALGVAWLFAKRFIRRAAKHRTKKHGD